MRRSSTFPCIISVLTFAAPIVLGTQCAPDWVDSVKHERRFVTVADGVKLELMAHPARACQRYKTVPVSVAVSANLSRGADISLQERFAPFEDERITSPERKNEHFDLPGPAVLSGL
jgi:hypothetical protein